MHHTTNRRNVTIAVMVATFLTAMDSTVVSTAMPTIVSDLGGLKIFSWVFAVYLLTTAVTTPIWGKLSDLFGRKRIFVIGTILFLLGSMFSGMSQTMDQLIWFRAFQGIGAGAVFPITLTIIGDLYELRQRAQIQGLFSAVWGISGILGPLVGGFFVDHLTWRWIFYINVPAGLASIIMIWIFLFEHFEKKQKHIDYLGAITFSIGITSLLYGLLSAGSTYAWSSPTLLGLFTIAILFVVLFFIIETHAKEPMLPLSLFRLRIISVSNIASFLASGILIGLSAYLPLWIQGILMHSATSSGLTLAPMSIGWPLGATIGGRLMLKLGAKRTTLFGMVALLFGTVWLSLVTIGSPQWQLVVVMLIVGFGFGFSMTAFTVLVQSGVEWNLRGTATASNQFMRTLGQTIGVAAFGTWFNQSLLSYATMHPAARGLLGTGINRILTPQTARLLPHDILFPMQQGLAYGLHGVYLSLSVLAIAGLIVVLWLPHHLEGLK